MEKTGLNSKEIKARNRTSILYLLNYYGALSRKDIAQKLSLTPAGVTKICANLIEDGLIEEIGQAKDTDLKAGRKKILLKLKLYSYYVLCINSDVDSITVSICDLSGKCINKKSINSTNDVNILVNSVSSLYNNCGIDKSRFLCASICVIGSPENNEYSFWNNEDIKQKIEEATNLKAIVGNNVQAFALAEMIYAHRINEKSVLFLKWGPGIGSAIATNGEILSGNDTGVAEIGHYIISKNGKKCRCGKYGCLETEASSKAIENQVGKGIKFNEIVSSKDADIINILDEKIDMVALSLANTATILNAQRIILFGTAFSNKSIAEKLVKQCKRYNDNLEENTIELSKLNNSIQYIGAVALAAKKFFFE